jgi:hypothetical protein
MPYTSVAGPVRYLNVRLGKLGTVGYHSDCPYLHHDRFLYGQLKLLPINLARQYYRNTPVPIEAAEPWANYQTF